MSAAPDSSSPTLKWEFGTAYEFFISLYVLHDPDRHGVRASWAAGIRSRIPAPERKFLEEALPIIGIPLCWIYQLPAPKDAVSALYALKQLPAAERAAEVMCLKRWEDPPKQILTRIARQGSWDQADLEALKPLAKKSSVESLTRFLNQWQSQEAFGEALLAALQAYHQAFFEEEEKRLAPILQAGLDRARELAQSLPPPDLIVELSQGVHLEIDGMQELVLAPAFWTTPLVLYDGLFNEKQMLILFGARPSDMSAIPGESVPDGLIRALKAISDPTRLKILNYLSKEEVTPSELARRLRLRAPTVTHHLNELRLAGLVHLTVAGNEKRYSARREALDITFNNLGKFLDNI
ncbi:MAG: winged helix-turn-helix transcriptional regulator [Anaerolineales bacterium]|nr:winged helix-turn-helix transcriptional regulator [Anaerolineales bacterium]